MNRAERIRQLVDELDQENTNDAEEAQFKLIEDFGEEAFVPLLEAAPRFSVFGRLCAIEIIEAVGDQRAAPLLIPWLASDNSVVREWSAGALGRVGAAVAIPALCTAWEQTKARGRPPDVTEAVSIRHALAALGARRLVMPDEIAGLEIDDDRLDRAWPAGRAAEVVQALADHRQVVAFVQYWTRKPEYDATNWYLITEAGTSAELDWARPWEELVEAARRQTMQAVQEQAASIPPQTVITVEWLDESDR